MSIPSSDLIFDVGMHLGEDTEFYLRKGYRVVGFEADPRLAQHCRQRFAAQIAAGRLTVVEGAIAPDTHGPTIAFYPSSLSVWGTVDPDWVARNERLGARSSRIEVRRVDIHQAFREHGTPCYLKIDIEGMDRHVLGAVAALDARPEQVSLESEKVRFEDLVAEMDTLRDLGYERFKIVQQKDIPGRTVSSLDLQGGYFLHRFANHSSGPFGDEIRQPWVGYDEALERYRAIFRDYERFGDNAAASAVWRGGPRMRKAVGWYDTHAKLGRAQTARPAAVSIVVTCGAPEGPLEPALRKLSGQSCAELILVEQGWAPQARRRVEEHHPAAKIVVVDPACALPRARNIAAHHAAGDFLLFVDAGVHLYADLGDWIRRHAGAGEFYTPDTRGRPRLRGTLIVGRDDFHTVTGYDDVPAGPAWEHEDLCIRLEQHGLTRVALSADGFVPGVQQDAHDRSPGDVGSPEHAGSPGGGAASTLQAELVGRLYTWAKRDMFALHRRELDLEARLELMKRIRDSVSAFEGSAEPHRDIRLALGTETGRHYRYRTGITYRISRSDLLPRRR